MSPYADEDFASMAEHPPAEFVSLASIDREVSGHFRNVMGVVSDCMPPRLTRQNEWQSTLSLTDPSLGGLGLKMVFFNSVQEDVPTPQIGDVIVISSAKVNSYRGDLQLLSSKLRTDWITIPRATIVQPSQRTQYAVAGGRCLPHLKSAAADAPTVSQQQWAITLVHAASTPDTPAQTVTAGHEPKAMPSVQAVAWKRDKACLVKDTQDTKFYDLTGQVIKIFAAGTSIHGDIVDLHLTDFTARTGLYDYQPPSEHDRYGDDASWRGPYGKQTIKIECHEPHGSWIMKNVVAGQIITLLNVRIKWNRDASFIEGNIFPDQKYPKKICAFQPMLVNRVVVDLLRRRKGYLATARRRGWKNLLPVVGYEADASGNGPEDSDSLAVEEPKRKKQKKSTKKQAEQNSELHDTVTSSYQETLQRQRDPNLNPSVLVTKRALETGLCRMVDIVDNPKRFLVVSGKTHSLPFVNCKYMLQMRVVDFYPHDIYDFSIRIPIKESYGLDTRWLWAFHLVVEAAHESVDACKERLVIEVSGVEAKRFLGLDPGDLRDSKGKHLYGDLIRKLRLLWGDLDEVKDDYFRVSNTKPENCQGLVPDRVLAVVGNRPFAGCVEEFGQPTEDDNSSQSIQEAGLLWRRHYKLCDTLMT